MWQYANPNPCRAEEPDCVVRAIALATEQDWDTVHWDLCRLSHERCTMPSVNWLWGLYLKIHGFEKFLLPESCPQCVVIGTGTHAVCIRNGCYLDTWDSGDEVPTYFYRKRGKHNA